MAKEHLAINRVLAGVQRADRETAGRVRRMEAGRQECWRHMAAATAGGVGV